MADGAQRLAWGLQGRAAIPRLLTCVRLSLLWLAGWIGYWVVRAIVFGDQQMGIGGEYGKLVIVALPSAPVLLLLLIPIGRLIRDFGPSEMTVGARVIDTVTVAAFGFVLMYNRHFVGQTLAKALLLIVAWWLFDFVVVRLGGGRLVRGL